MRWLDNWRERRDRKFFLQKVQQAFIRFNLGIKDKDMIEIYNVLKLEEQDYGCDLKICLPMGLSTTKVKECLKDVGESIFCKIKFKRESGRVCTLSFAFDSLARSIPFQETMVPVGYTRLGISFPSHFGSVIIDLAKDAHTHLLIAGTTGMAKTGTINYIITSLMLKTQGKATFIVASGRKMSDYAPFKHLPQFSFCKSNGELIGVLDQVVKEGDRRATLLEDQDLTDIEELAERPEPIFIVVDEFARFADEERVQDLVTEIAETYRFVDIHLILATQRPDVQTVLKSRVRANILTRIALTTADEANSKIIINVPDAAHLGRIPGRAILDTGDLTEIQVPYVKTEQCKKLMERFKDDQPRPIHHPVLEEVQSVEPGPSRKVNVRRSRKSRRHSQPYLKEVIAGFTHHPDSSA